MMTLTPYKAEILSQPTNLRNALANLDLSGLEDIKKNIQQGSFDRLILTGMGASFYSLYPAWLYLSALKIPVITIDLSELIHFAHALVTPRTLLWVVSQSGRTAELMPILDKEQFNPAYLLATVNDVSSPLAQSADLFLPIQAEVEKTVSTRTYINSLVINQLAAHYLNGEDIQEPLTAYYKAADT
ncbi:MAG: SIS domain-containing protein, partial [Anaerolineales bacterium]